MRRIALVLAAVAVSSCGGGGAAGAPPRLPHGLGTELAEQASLVETSLENGDACGAAAEAAQLRQMVASALSSGQVPSALRGPLSSSVDSLVGEITCAPAPAAKDRKPKPPGERRKHDHGHGHDHGEGGED